MMLKVVFIALISSVICSEDEARLYDHILTSANPNVRPVRERNSPVDVHLSFQIQALKDFNVKSQNIKAVGFLLQKWTDEYISWNPTEYGGAMTMLVPISEIWTPRTQMVPGTFSTDSTDATAMVTANGTVNYFIQSLFKTACVFEKEEKSTCKFTFMPWAYNTKEVKLNVSPIMNPKQFFVEHRDWIILNETTVVHEVAYPCCPHSQYGDITTYVDLGYIGKDAL